jgi:hypothetical protein
MDVLLGLGAFVVLLSVPTLLGLIYLELRQRRMFGPRSIISADSSNSDTAAIAMSLQAELERLRTDVHGALSSVSTDIERVHDQLLNRDAVGIAAPTPAAIAESPRFDPDRATAQTELYGALSRLDIAFLAVARPVLLPGESFDLEQDLPTDAFRWESWNDVGAAAYHFAEVFSERRIRLDSETRDRLNAIIGSIRRCMTARLYPLLTDVDSSIPEEHRASVAEVVSSIANDIRDARDVLEHASAP